MYLMRTSILNTTTFSILLFLSCAKMTYDDNGMYFATLMEEPHVWGNFTEHV